MTTINEKLKYEKPSMKVYELQQRARLLAGSQIQDYNVNPYEEE